MNSGSSSPSHSHQGSSSSSKVLRNIFSRRSAPSSTVGHLADPPPGGGPRDRPPGTSAQKPAGDRPSLGTGAGTSASDPNMVPHQVLGPQPTGALGSGGGVGSSGGIGSSGGVPEPAVQRHLVESLLDKPYVEGEIWYTVLVDWLNQWKRHVGLLPPRKHYHNRQPPGPITTSRQLSPGYSAAKVHADAWRILLACYGLAEGHKVIKQVCYTYGNRTELENSLNTFNLSLKCEKPEDEDNGASQNDINKFDPSSPCHVALRLSKMEKVGHVEWRARQLFHVPNTCASRLWGKMLDSDKEWRPLFRRDTAIGHALELESDFLRSCLLLEVADDNGEWAHIPENNTASSSSKTQPSGRLVERSIFDDVTTSWEQEVHQQIDHIGKTFVRQIHGSLAGLMARARDFVADRESSLRDRERTLETRETTLNNREEMLVRKEADLSTALQEHALASELLEKQREENQQDLEAEKRRHLQEIEKAHWGLQQAKETLEQERQTFQSELQRMTELNAVQESRVKLDIGGAIFMTSRLTLTRDPDSMLAAMFSGRHQLSPEPDGSFFIDRDGTHFRYVLNYLRDGGIKDGTLPQNEALWRELYTEAEYYQVSGLQEYLQGLMSQAMCANRERHNRRT